jgi:hypothetical protein
MQQLEAVATKKTTQKQIELKAATYSLSCKQGI